MKIDIDLNICYAISRTEIHSTTELKPMEKPSLDICNELRILAHKAPVLLLEADSTIINLIYIAQAL